MIIQTALYTDRQYHIFSLVRDYNSTLERPLPERYDEALLVKHETSGSVSGHCRPVEHRQTRSRGGASSRPNTTAFGR